MYLIFICDLFYLHDLYINKNLINICRIKNEFDSIPSYIYDDIDNWSMNDLVNVRNGTFLLKIETIIQKSEAHVFNCEVGSA